MAKKASKKVAKKAAKVAKIKEMTAEQFLDFAHEYGFKAVYSDKPRVETVVVTGRWFKKSEPKAIKVKRFPARR